MTPRDWILILAAALVVAGVGLIYPPAAIIVAGVALAVIFLVDIEPRRRA